MKSLEKRIARLEEHIRRDEEEDEGSGLGTASDYQLIICREGNDEPQCSPAYQLESEEAALGRWGLTHDDIPAGLWLSLMPCIREHGNGHHMQPMLLRFDPSRPATKKEMADLAQILTQARARSKEEQARWQQERWERERETLRKLKQEQDPTKEPAG